MASPSYSSAILGPRPALCLSRGWEAQDQGASQVSVWGKFFPWVADLSLYFYGAISARFLIMLYTGRICL